jgi:hypothetical protein
MTSHKKGKWMNQENMPALFYFLYCNKCYNKINQELKEKCKARIEFLKARASKEGLTVNQYYQKHRKELRKK